MKKSVGIAIWRLVWLPCAAALALWVLLFAVYYGHAAYQKVQAVRHTSAFLHELKQEEFRQAVTHYGEPLDGEGLRLLHEREAFKLADYGHVRAEFDDGCVCVVHAELTFETKAKMVETDAIITLRKGKKPGQVCAITPSGVERGEIPELDAWNRIVCGHDDL
ncbi:hypothetical protein [Paenibacillus methanolicus]|uniref:Uncharacterized protein n=1 Tax=Paenibacillus methanolicus TaxID=582686 RepID=A0A5S5BUH0_9BACL|nr:hypothetical protein [Paenibacillus methanolicus]TYP69800.1 hypothetical protein BCM02_113132 [Paenibacillus methanolicus]